MEQCRICGAFGCKKHSKLFQNIKKISGFSGSSPPEVFIGKWDYPNVYIGVLSPQNEFGNTQSLSSQEFWHKNRLDIPDILSLRAKLIYGRAKSNVKKPLSKEGIIPSLQEIAMSSNSVSTDFQLEKPVIEKNKEHEPYSSVISRAASVKSIKLSENPKIHQKMDYLTNDSDAKSQTAMLELEKADIPTASIIQVLSAGLLGKQIQRKLVPTRWAITAVDDTLSKNKLKKIKYFQEISEISVFTSEYLGNHYEFMLLPDKFSFEVIEINQNNQNAEWHDYESFFGRKTYAESVTGAYYANRLALCEYLEKIQRQCSCIVFREINPEIYTQSMGVGILRQISREAFKNPPQKFSSIQEAISSIQGRIKLPVSIFSKKSIILENYGKQNRLNKWLN